jgi:hypothetical protein
MDKQNRNYIATMEIRKENSIGRFHTTQLIFAAPYPLLDANIFDVAIREARKQGNETLFVHRIELAD